MNISTAKLFIFLQIAALIILCLGNRPLFAREGWNEPPRQPSYDKTGRLRINRDFFELSANTGGDFYFWAPGEFAASAASLRIPVTSSPILLDYGNNDQFVKSYEVPVDSGVALLSIFIGAERKDMVVLHRPDGRSTSANPAFVSEQHFRHMNLITVEKPEPGVWLLEFGGAGYYAVSVRYSAGNRRHDIVADEGIELLAVEFVEPGGRPGHEGLFPVKGKVRAGESRLCRISIAGAITEPVAEFVTRDNKIIGRINLQPLTPESGDERIGTCTVPSIPFRTRVSGRNAKGNPFQRMTSAIYTPET